MAKCDLCEKKVITGRKFSYRGTQVTKRFPTTQKPNIRKVRVDVGGTTRKVSMCSRCLRTARSGKAV